jgi:NADH:ubiquinone oxidoreductase subunit 2 (subunit N)
MANAAVSAAYYLRIVATMYLRPAPEPITAGFPVVTPGAPLAAPAGAPARPSEPTGWAIPLPIAAGVAIAVLGTLVFGVVLPATNGLTARTQAAQLGTGSPATATAAAGTPAAAQTPAQPIAARPPGTPEAAAR